MNAGEVERFFAETLAERRKKPQEDLLSMFASAEVGGDKLTDDEILGICFLFLLAGLDTVTDTLECFFAYLAQHPEQRRLIVEDPAIIPTAVEELLRWETPVTGVPRVVQQDVELGGCPMHKGRPRRHQHRLGQHRRGRPRRRLRRRSSPATPSTSPSGPVCTAASDPTWPAWSCGRRCGSGTGASPTTRSRRAPSSNFMFGLRQVDTLPLLWSA